MRPSTTGAAPCILPSHPKCDDSHGPCSTARRASSGGHPPKSRKKRNEEAANNDEANKWRALALTKKKKLKVRIPQRQFLGESRELENSIRERTKQEIIKILDKDN